MPDTSDEDAQVPRKAPALPTQIKRILWEGFFVAVIGTIVAFAANAVSPRGLKLTQNYFPGATRTAPPSAATTNLAQNPAAPRIPAPSPAEQLAKRLEAKGLHLVDSNQLTQLYRDPRYEQELIVFIDARDDRHYEEGHIPGAYQFDHYRAANYIAIVLPVCETSEKIVVYCMGGDCEDSEYAAITLRDLGIPVEKLFIYGGGMMQWITNGLPVEAGGRKSGFIRTNKP